VSWSSLNRLGPNDEVVEVIGFGMDITQRKLAERERDRFEVQLRHSQKLEAIGELAAGIAHEINTPTQYIGDNTRFLGDSFSVLESVVASVRGLARSTSDEDALRRLEQTRNAADDADLDYLLQEIPRAITQSLEGVDRVSRIVRAMKDFSHPGTEDRVPIDLNHALETTVTVATNEWKYVADVVMDFDTALPNVLGHAGELNQAFLNLIVNAAHAISDATGESGERGVIQISTRGVDGIAEVRISDTGTGISERIRDRIFDPFFTTKPAGRGTGQGLAICHSVIVQHGGAIRFETEVGRGTTFFVTLPASTCGSAIIEDAA
jgi:signal transduction histidine kinase